MLDAFRRRDWFRPMAFEWPRWPELPLEGRFPGVDRVNRDKDIQIKAEVPGIEKEDLPVSVTERTLMIKGESRHEEESEEGDLHRREIRSGSFSRILTLPEDVDGTQAKAKYQDGLLELTLPKRAEGVELSGRFSWEAERPPSSERSRRCRRLPPSALSAPWQQSGSAHPVPVR
jgi:HSP20 family protein